MSKGIHELNEEECLSMYPYIKTGIELLLDDIIAEKERIEKEKVFTRFIEDIRSVLSSHVETVVKLERR